MSSVDTKCRPLGFRLSHMPCNPEPHPRHGKAEMALEASPGMSLSLQDQGPPPISVLLLRDMGLRKAPRPGSLFSSPHIQAQS